jgi:hypothetical protein
VSTILVLEWLERHAPPLAAVYCWYYNRLTGSRCFAVGCGRLLLLHTPWQMGRCYDSPMAIQLTDRGWLHASGVDPESVVGPASRASA